MGGYADLDLHTEVAGELIVFRLVFTDLNFCSFR